MLKPEGQWFLTFNQLLTISVKMLNTYIEMLDVQDSKGKGEKKRCDKQKKKKCTTFGYPICVTTNQLT